MNKPFLSEIEYREILHKALGKQGLKTDFIEILIQTRFPMYLESVLAECSARGIDLSPADCDEFLWDIWGEAPKTESGELIEAKTCRWDPENVELLLMWASQSGRGEPSRTSAAIAKIQNYETEPS